MPADEPGHPDDSPAGRPDSRVTPLPVPEEAHGILLVGGSFDPPTRIHTEAADRARTHTGTPDHWLVFVPAARSPFKPDPPAPDEHRAAMLRLAIHSTSQAAVWTDELDRAAAGAPSYWIDTLRRARSLRPSLALRFLIGADQAAAFHKWREAHEILQLARPVVLPREPWGSADAVMTALRDTSAWTDDELRLWEESLVPVPAVQGSATQARAALAQQPPDTATLSRLLDPAVLEYIRTHRLYAAS